MTNTTCPGIIIGVQSEVPLRWMSYYVSHLSNYNIFLLLFTASHFYRILAKKRANFIQCEQNFENV